MLRYYQAGEAMRLLALILHATHVLRRRRRQWRMTRGDAASGAALSNG